MAVRQALSRLARSVEIMVEFGVPVRRLKEVDPDVVVSEKPTSNSGGTPSWAMGGGRCGCGEMGSRTPHASGCNKRKQGGEAVVEARVPAVKKSRPSSENSQSAVPLRKSYASKLMSTSVRASDSLVFPPLYAPSASGFFLREMGCGLQRPK
jgi:hypothetical protein